MAEFAMMHPIRVWLVAVAFVGLIWLSAVQPCRADDEPTLPALTVPAQAPAAGSAAPEALPSPSPVEDRPAAFILPPPPDYTVVNERWIGGPLLERPEAAPPGVFVNIESSVVWPHLRNELVGGVVTLAQTSGAPVSTAVGLPPGAGMPITGDLINFPGNPLNPTATPRFELGYRFPDGFGELKLGYRFLDSEGSDTLVVGELGPAAQKGRLDVNFIDLDYGIRQFSLGPDWEMRTAVGLRNATVFFDSQVNFLRPVTITTSPFGTGPFTRLTQAEAVSNWYIGAHAVFEVGRKLWVPGLTLFGRLEGSGMYGRVHQTFKETFVEAPGFTQTSVRSGVGTPLLATQVGLSWDVPNWNHCRFMIGYQYEMWWQFGRGNDDLSFGTLDDQGIFLRAEINF
jgi:hypothetical protein